ncbi:MAG: hypothetical protein ABW252_21405 [Polyangiales bacterium]
MISTLRTSLALLALGATACALTHERGDTTDVASAGTRIDCSISTERCVGDERDRPVVADDACPTAPDDPARAADVLDLVAVHAVGGGAPSKGDVLEVILDLTSNWAGTLHVTPRLTHASLRDFVDVPLGSEGVELRCGRQRVTVRGGPFLSMQDGSAHFALTTGEYLLGSVSLTVDAPAADDGAHHVSLAHFAASRFRVAPSDALLVPVLFDPGYLPRITANPYSTPESYLEAAFHRASQVAAHDGDPGLPYPGGFDAMMRVRHLFRAFPSMPASNPTKRAWCELTADHVRTVLGLSDDWRERGARHGFDYLIGLTPALGGGVACPWLDSQVSGFIERDLDRQQIIVVHESGHLFGAPHCDDVGNGRGGPLQGYVMCSGEKHPRYPAQFVWHQSSRDAMRSHWD